MSVGTLYCVPVPLSQALPMAAALSAEDTARVAALDVFVAENARTARAFLRTLALRNPLQAIEIREIDAHTDATALDAMLAPVRAGRDLGLMSEAGCPGVADPGERLVARAHQEGLRVVPLIGPSALLLTLMASGLNGQAFAFVGYLPAAPAERERRLRELEQRSARNCETLLAIETPYRVQPWLASALRVLAHDTRLTVAQALTTSNQSIATRSVAAWRTAPPDLGKSLVVFAWQAEPLSADPPSSRLPNPPARKRQRGESGR
jgi:16S rRNA (cytidine1402-2'-O)-methyltransferase